MTTAVIVTAVAACVGGEPLDLTFNLEIENRKLNVSRLEVRQNDKLTLNIVADEPGEFHLHGYDYEENISPSKVTKLVFEANATGKFNITFHPSGEHGEEHLKDTDHSHATEDMKQGHSDKIEEVLIGALEVRPR